jgi:uncharacterized protein YgbK (DUF1537 family)
MKRLGIVADDNTGASDAAGMLTEQGVRTVLLLGPEPSEATRAALEGFDAIVLGTQNRSMAPAEAAEATRRAVGALREMGADQFQVKYCSTFDSTRQGNIGPTLDAALEELGARGSIVCPALPVNGRTVYMGHLFVGTELLSDSALKDHPLNPMTDANLVRWLGHQTERPVGLVPLERVRAGAAALREGMRELLEGGVSYLVTDVVDNEDLRTIAEAVRDWPLVSGGSGITWALGGVRWAGRKALDFEARLSAIAGGTLVVSGSQSPMTRKQNERAAGAGFAMIELDLRAVIEGTYDLDSVAAEAGKGLANRPGKVVVYSPAGRVQETLARGAEAGLSEVETGERIAAALAEVAGRLVEAGVVGRLVVSGGETSGCVCRRLGLEALEVGLPIAPGVPYCFPMGGPEMAMVLKSGNFGGEDLLVEVADGQGTA